MRLIRSQEDHAAGTPAGPAGQAPDALTRMEARELFRQMAHAELTRNPHNNFLRKRLITYAAVLGLTALDAGRILSEVWSELAADGRSGGRADCAGDDEAGDFRPHGGRTTILRFPADAPPEPSQRVRWPVPLLLGLVCIVCGLILRLL